jgi:hypothetical protein
MMAQMNDVIPHDEFKIEVFTAGRVPDVPKCLWIHVTNQ